MTLELTDEKGNKCGKIIVSTQLIVVPKNPLEYVSMNSNCCLQIKMLEANFLKDSDLVGKQDPYV